MSELDLLIERLSHAQRKRLPSKDFVFPDADGKGGRWPIQSAKQALIAIDFMRKGRGEESEYGEIRKAIESRYGRNKKVMAALNSMDEDIESPCLEAFYPKSPTSEEDALYQVGKILENAREAAGEEEDRLETQPKEMKRLRLNMGRWRKLSDVNWMSLLEYSLVTGKQANFGKKVQADYDFDLER